MLRECCGSAGNVFWMRKSMDTKFQNGDVVKRNEYRGN